MAGSDSQCSTGASTLVILLAPEVFGDNPDTECLRIATIREGRAIRVLVRIKHDEKDGEDAQFAFAKSLADPARKLEILVGALARLPDDWQLPFVRMPPGSSDKELDEVALALSDVVMVDASGFGQAIVTRARELEKTLIEAKDQTPCMAPSASVTRGLDPDSGYWCRMGRHIFGRAEQAALRCLEFDWLGTRVKWSRRSWSRLLAPLGPKWRPVTYYDDPNLPDAFPDAKMRECASPLISHFGLLDRAALFGSYMQRDQIWVTHGLAAFAVLAAVMAILEPKDHEWVRLEFVLLIAIAVLVWLTRRFRLQDRWTACRLGAEQLRIARMCLPLLVVPDFLSTVDHRSDRGASPTQARDITLDVVSEVKRVVRDHGLPLLPSDFQPAQAARSVLFVVSDQIGYHETNHRSLETAEARLRFLTKLVFLGVLLCVLVKIVHHEWHCLPYFEWIPLAAAAGPAFAAALHGAATRLGIVQRIALSEVALRDLRPIRDGLTDIIGKVSHTNEDWLAISNLTLRAARAMGQENTSWHGQVRLQREGFPA